MADREFEDVNAQSFSKTARTEFFGGLSARTFYSRIQETRMLKDGVRVFDAAVQNVFVYTAPLAMVYGFNFPRKFENGGFVFQLKF